MKRKRKGNILTILIVLFVCICFCLPSVLLSQQEKRLEKQIFTREKQESKLDVEAERIYLVKAIHCIEEESNIIAVEKWHEAYSTDQNEKEVLGTTEVGKQIAKLEDFQILQSTGINSPVEYTIYSNTTGYRNDKNEYLLDNVQVVIEQELGKSDYSQMLIEQGQYELVMEEKTGKILSIVLPKQKLYEGKTKEEILESFTHYLDLYIIDDWKYEQMEMKSQKYRGWKEEIHQIKSEKAGLVIALYENDAHFMIGIRSQSNLYESLDSNYRITSSPAN